MKEGLPQIIRRHWIGAAALAVALVVLIPLTSATSAAGGALPFRQAAPGSDLEGTVTDRASGHPIRGAEVTIPALGLSTSSDPNGRFGWQDVALSQSPYTTTIQITAPGYGDWTLQDVRLIEGDTLIVTAELGPEPILIVVPPPRSERPQAPEEQTSLQALQGGVGNQMDLPIPGSIRVRVTGYPYCDTSRPYTVEVVDFLEYVKHVLPNEWIPSWPGESLRAGAMAAKMYAWSIIAAGGKWPDADVYDSTCDQVYNPAVSYASTDAAVEFIWNWRQTRDGPLVRDYYRAYYSQCVDAGLAGRCMGQYESEEMAYDGDTWDEIITFFYPGSLLTPVYTPPGGFSLRYQGNGYGNLDRVTIAIDSPARPVDVGDARTSPSNGG